jgi:hypothetical protein
MGDIFDVVFEEDRDVNVFSELHLDPEYIDTDKAYNQPLDNINYNDRLALGFEMMGEYD